MQTQVSTSSRNSNNGSGHIAARAMNPSERADLAWWLRTVRECEDGAPYLVTFRGVTFAASPEEAIRVLAWGGSLVQTTYGPRRGRFAPSRR